MYDMARELALGRTRLRIANSMSGNGHQAAWDMELDTPLRGFYLSSFMTLNTDSATQRITRVIEERKHSWRTSGAPKILSF